VQLKENAVPTLAALLYYTDDLKPGDLFYPPRLNDGSIRGKAAGMLARIGTLRRIGRSARFALLRALKDDISDVRVLAAAALAEIGDRAAIPDMEDADRRIHYVKLGAELPCEICNAIEQLESK
jgi:HEAT repeat protein